ncbi:MAG: hypothetical protein ACQEQL_06290 [Pseudomonadota bacterium]
MSKSDPKRGRVATLISTPSGKTNGKTEDADFLLHFLENWFISAQHNLHITDKWNAWGLKPIVNLGPPDDPWQRLKQPRRIGMSLGPSDWFRISLSQVNREISANSAKRTLKLDGEWLWDTLVAGIETGRSVAAQLGNELRRTSACQDKPLNSLKAITENIELLGNVFAGLPPQMVTALKDEMLNPRPFDKKALTYIKYKSGIYSRQKPQPEKSTLLWLEEEIARNNRRGPSR